jgi:predicted nucleotidyltransferase
MFFDEVLSILEEKKINKSDILDIILVGSRLYNTNTDISDYDYIVITKREYNGLSINKSNKNITIFSKESYEKCLEEQKMLCLESFFAERKFKYKNYNHFIYKLNEKLLIESTRKNTIETLKKAVRTNDYNLAKKRFFHAIRINSYKDQILNCGEIHNFRENFAIWNELKKNYDNSLKYLLVKYKGWLK